MRIIDLHRSGKSPGVIHKQLQINGQQFTHLVGGVGTFLEEDLKCHHQQRGNGFCWSETTYKPQGIPTVNLFLLAKCFITMNYNQFCIQIPSTSALHTFRLSFVTDD